MNKKNRNALVILILMTVSIFALIIIGLKIVSGSMLSVQNIMALLGFSLVLGVISAVLYFYQLKFAYYIFDLGILIGLIQMYRSFFKDPNGWGDLAGIASLFVFIMIGVVVGLFVQLILYIARKFKRKV